MSKASQFEIGLPLGIYLALFFLLNHFSYQDTKLYLPFTALILTSVFYLYQLALKRPDRDLYGAGRRVIITLLVIIAVHLIICMVIVPNGANYEAAGERVRYQQVLIRGFQFNFLPVIPLVCAALVAPAIAIAEDKVNRLPEVWMFFGLTFFEVLFTGLAMICLFPAIEMNPFLELLAVCAQFPLAAILPGFIVWWYWHDAVKKLGIR